MIRICLRRAFFSGICMLAFAIVWTPAALADDDPANQTVEEMFRSSGNSTPGENRMDAEIPPPASSPSPGVGELLGKTALALGLIFLLIYGLARLLARRQWQAGANAPLQVRAGIYLGHNKSLKLVKVGKNYYLLGVGENIQLIREFSSPEEREELEELFLSSGALPANAALDFNRFGKWVRVKRQGKQEGEKRAEGFQSQLEKRLEEIRQKRKQFLEDAGENVSEEGKGDVPAQ